MSVSMRTCLKRSVFGLQRPLDIELDWHAIEGDSRDRINSSLIDSSYDHKVGVNTCMTVQIVFKPRKFAVCVSSVSQAT